MKLTPKELLDTMLGYLGFVVEIQETDDQGSLKLQVFTHESEPLIGHDGETLDHLQFLVNRLAQAQAGDEEVPRILVDVEHWRTMRDDNLINRIKQVAERVRISGRPSTLEPMNSYDRRIVHNAFKDDPELMTSSPDSGDRLKRITIARRK